MTLDETFKAAKAGDLTNDTTYKVGEISRKTGLQKQPDGSWAPPKTGARQPAQKQESGSNETKPAPNSNESLALFAAGGDKEKAKKIQEGMLKAAGKDPAASREEKLNQIRTVHSSEKLGNGQTLELTESKKNGKFFVKIDGKPVSSWKTKEAAQKEFDAYKNGEDPAAARYNEIVGEYNKKHPENPMETKEPVNRSAASEEKKRLINVPGQTAAENLQQWENSAKTEARNLGENQVLLQNSMGDVIFYSEGDDEKIDQAEARGYKKMSLVRPDGSVKRHQTNNPAASSETKSKMKPESSNMGYDWSHGRYTAPKDLSNAAPQDIAKELQTLNATGRLGRIKTKEGGSTHGKNYFNSTHTTFDIKKIDEEYVYIDNREGTWKVPLNEIEMIQGWHDYGKRDPETGEVTPLRPDPITDAAYTAESVNAPRENLERKLTGDSKIRIRK